jgi:phosphoribosyl-ATP pyrophosphohydrolase
MSFTLEQLDARLAERAKAAPNESYTAQLLQKGVEKRAEKLGEEATEAVIAAVKNDKQQLAAEAGDVLYHLLVLLRAGDVPLEAVMDELERRTAQSGLSEKATRNKGAS